jgi:hypothetical protein
MGRRQTNDLAANVALFCRSEASVTPSGPINLEGHSATLTGTLLVLGMIECEDFGMRLPSILVELIQFLKNRLSPTFLVSYFRKKS